MKKTLVFLILLALISLLILAGGCGDSDDGGTKDDVNVDDNANRAEFDRGFEDGQAEGYTEGYADGKEEAYDPGVLEEPNANDYYALGYNEGWAAGYDDGYDDAVKVSVSPEEELAEVTAAMLDFVKQNSAPGMEFRIENVLIQGDEAAGIAVCTSEVLENPLIVMKKGGSGWQAVDFGTGIEPPSWYQY